MAEQKRAENEAINADQFLADHVKLSCGALNAAINKAIKAGLEVSLKLYDMTMHTTPSARPFVQPTITKQL